MFVKGFFVLFCIALLSVGFCVPLTTAETGENVAFSALANAEERVVSAYEIVLDAEHAGANVSGLLVRLNEAGWFLSQARMTYKAGDFDGAVRLADLSKGIGEEVKNEAQDLKVLATVEGIQRLWFTVAGSVIAIIWIAFGSYLSWRFFKRRYYRRVLEMKPEVAPE